MPAQGVAALAGLKQRISGVVGSILASDERTREVIAAEMSVLLGEEVSRAMLDAYASPARVDHKIPVERLIALVVVTACQDMLDPIMREGGMAVLVGDEVHTARLGHIDRQMELLRQERKRVAGRASPIRGEIHGRSRHRKS